MLPRSKRLGKHEIKRIFRKGKRIKSSSFILITEKSEETKVGVVIGKKCFPRAVDRNKAKRRVRSVLKDNLVDLPKGMNAIIYALPNISKLDFKGVEEEITELVDKIKKKD